jgi:energy-coupling factor transport system substrate-specific component
MTDLSKTRFLAIVVVCAGLNLGIGFVVATLKLPFYLDSIGTVLATMIGGIWVGIACGLLSVLVGSAYTPTLWAYGGTAIVIAVYVSVVRRAGYLRSWIPTILFGLGLGVITAITSAPVTTYVWKGVSISGADALTSFFSATGKTLLDSVLLGGLSSDPIDKLITSLVAFSILRGVPKKWFERKTVVAE